MTVTSKQIQSIARSFIEAVNDGFAPEAESAALVDQLSDEQAEELVDAMEAEGLLGDVSLRELREGPPSRDEEDLFMAEVYAKVVENAGRSAEFKKFVPADAHAGNAGGAEGEGPCLRETLSLSRLRKSSACQPISLPLGATTIRPRRIGPLTWNRVWLRALP
ncbi:hypothetical protein [Arvimicrobium flavum]|uniref:hypothetical protein n=1 Tax=Arvimicrobium flavum TaxID=3393320 RepID=UPI00237B2D16|nr:hypothetical protein [Mesorhizobium shangrilense]